MSTTETVPPKTSLSNPLLIFKVGVLGAAPLHVMGELADAYDATFLSSDETRLELIEKRESEGMDPARAGRIDTNGIRSLVVARSIAALQNDEDVVLDMFFNTANSRRIPQRIARETGAKTVALWMKTPSQVAIRRTIEWAKRDAFVIPMSRWDTPPAEVAERMSKHVEVPSKKEGLDYVFTLRGIRNDTDAMLEQFDARLTQTGLADRYEDIEP